MKTISLTVNLIFDEDISDDNLIKEVAGNVLEALIAYRDEVGLAPAETDITTESIEVREKFTNTVLNYK
jgi:hypothetical protein